MKIRVIDFETTGTDKDLKAGKKVEICEVGYTDVDVGTRYISMTMWHFVDPGMPIPPEARAIHHISDNDVANAISPAAARTLLMADMEPGDLFAAHRAAFEQAFFPGGTHEWICTYVAAKHLYDDLPSYSNQALRYILGIDDGFEWPVLAMPPHRAGPDSYVTAGIIRHMLVENTPRDLTTLTRLPILQKRVPFGKYEGQLWADMDAGYLEWILKKDFDDEVMNTARHYLRQRRQDSTPYPFA